MSNLELRLFGPPILRSREPSGQALALPAKSLALLAFLALEGGHHDREHLATLLWGDSDEEKARASLRQALKSLRQILGGQVDITRSGAALNAGLHCDAATFLATSTGDPATAAACEVHRFLEGFAPRHAPVFEEWVARTRHRLLERHRQALDACGQAALAHRDWRKALDLGERWLDREPLCPRAARLVIEARYLSGDAAGALATWEVFSSQYALEFGAEPNGDLHELVRRVRTTPSARPTDDQSRAVGEVHLEFEPGLVGRDAEWKCLEDSWQEVERGNGRVVVIEGEAGAGKSRLLEDFSRWVTARGGQCLSARAWESAQATRRDTLLALLRGALGHPGVAGADPISLGIIARVMPELRRQFPALVPHEAEPGTAVLEEAVADLLLAVAEDHPLLVVLDDFQWCDAETTAVVHYLVRRLALSRVLWCLTVTPGEAPADAPAIRVARALRILPAVVHLRLTPLTAEQVWEVVQHLGPVHPEAAARELAARIHEVTAGNSFYVVELLKAGLAEGWIAPAGADGGWHLAAGENRVLQMERVSPSLHGAIAQRVARLPEELHLMLMTLAAHEHGLPADVLSQVHGMSRLRLAAMGDELVQRHLAVEESGNYRCRHPLIARVVRESASQARRRELHRAIAQALLAAAEAQGSLAVPGDVAYHAELGGDRSLAYDHALLASEMARASGAPSDALHWLDVAARQAGSPEEAAVVDRATAELLGPETVVPRARASRPDPVVDPIRFQDQAPTPAT